VWLFSQPHPEGETWAIYCIALGVEAVCVVKSVSWIRSRNLVRPLTIGLVTAGFALAGILAVHAFFGTVVWLGTRP
jgi:hypothetical protein